MPCELCQQPTSSTFGVCDREGECREELRRRMNDVPEMWHVKIHRGDSVEIVSGAIRKQLRKKQERAENASDVRQRISGKSLMRFRENGHRD